MDIVLLTSAVIACSIAVAIAVWVRLSMGSIARASMRTWQDFQSMIPGAREVARAVRVELEEDLQRDRRRETAWLEEASRLARILEESLPVMSRHAAALDEHAPMMGQLLVNLTDPAGPYSLLPPELPEQDLMADLSHVLRTPLNAITINADIVRLQLPRDTGESDIADKLRDINDAVETCLASLATFRELVGVVRATGTRGLELDAGVAAQFRAAKSVTGKQSRLDAHLPPDVDGFSNNYLLALIQPLLENAVQHGSSGTVSVALEQSADEVMITIGNPVVDVLDLRAFDSRDSAPSAHGRGLGVVIARRLANFRRGTIEYAVGDDLLRVTVRLPRSMV